MSIYVLSGGIRNGLSVNQPSPAGTGGANYIHDDTTRVQRLTSLDSTQLGKTLASRYLAEGWDRDYPDVAASGDVATPSSNTAAVVTYDAAGQNRFHKITGVAFGYSAAPTSGVLRIEDGAGTVVFSEPVTASGPGFFPFDPAKQGSPDTALIVTLTAGGPNVSGQVSVLGHRIV